MAKVAYLIAIATVLIPATLAFWVQKNDQIPFVAEKPTQNPICMALKCGTYLAKCLLSSECRRTLDCMKSCDPSDALCTSACFFDYSNDLFNEMVGCAVKNKCIARLTWSNLTCPDMRKHSIEEVEFPVTKFGDIKEMFVARGSHPIYDCFPCQRLQFGQNANGSVAVRWSTVTKTNNVRDAHYVLRQDGKSSLATNYLLFGMPVEEHYYILDYTEDFVLYFYCGFGFDGEYQGSLIYSRFPSSQVPQVVLDRFSDVLRRVNLPEYIPELESFCKPDYNRECQNMN